MDALKKLEEQLTCPICLDTYSNPKLLQCHHVFCQECLEDLATPNQQGQLTVTCPNCRVVTPISASGVAGLQSAFRVNQLLEIVEEHKKISSACPEDGASSGISGSTITKCSEHDGRDVELYCETCEEVICFKCIMNDEKHHSHSYKELSKTFKGFHGEILSSLKPMEKQLRSMQRALEQLDTRCEEITKQEVSIESDINTAIAKLHEAIEARKTDLVSQLHQLTQAKLKTLEAQREQTKTNHAQLSSCLHLMKENLRTSGQGEVLLLKNMAEKQIQRLTSSFQSNIPEPDIEADITFSFSDDLIEQCKKHGNVYSTNVPDPSECYATGKSLEIASVGEMASVILNTYNLNGQPCEIETDFIECVLMSEIKGTRVRTSIEKSEISYQPTTKGLHHLHIKVQGQHIKGSPYPVLVRSPLEECSTPILTIGGLREPLGVAVNQRGEVIVAEGGKGCISVYSPSGKKLRTIHVRSSHSSGSLLAPVGVTLDDKGNIFATNPNDCCVLKFSVEGDLLTAVGSEGSGPLQFTYPSGIAYNPDNGRLYVGDGQENCIQILNSDLSYYGSFGHQGSRKGQFANPRQVACDSFGNVYVADQDNHRIQVFTAQGVFVRAFGKRGRGRGELNSPCGIAVDFEDRVLVSECSNHRISVFTSEGQFLTSFGTEGKGPRLLEFPQGLAVDGSGVVYVCDTDNNYVHLF